MEAVIISTSGKVAFDAEVMMFSWFMLLSFEEPDFQMTLLLRQWSWCSRFLRSNFAKLTLFNAQVM